ncbi:MAG TPA: aldehyde ferredoxin oxidoreductase [Fervidicoccus fontis]|uniref:Aldehyde ferredoxin oxidoreductase n=1 Tax=Fervidicoccus fontis TaxID=683846 RepID=A0A7C2YLJ1_9CREN|nr:MAG: aldehyde ferredoxin oxidoreductase [Fervidicoccus sp.]HEU97792.1 aldehyde ferredoxin oxidoreductase [Fervidicoccus fontis]
MNGWWGKTLVVDLWKKRAKELELDINFYSSFIGGRGLAIRLLWELAPMGVDPLSPHNPLIIASGPLSGLPIPSSGKLVVASKSPLTGGYGDGNIGTMASHHLKRSGYDAIAIIGASEKPIYLYIDDGKVEFLDAESIWGLNTFKAEEKLKEVHGRNLGILLIGPAGENGVRYSTVVSQKGRSGGRPGMGAVMGSKKLKAIVLRGTKEPPLYDRNALAETSKEAYNAILNSKGYRAWIAQGTMATVAWSNAAEVLPTMNFREGVWEESASIGGDLMEKLKVDRRGCPYCNMQCGNVIEDLSSFESELDYENVAMLGSNVLLGDLREVAELNRMADEMGIDTISLGNSLAFYMEASERGLVSERLEWGDFREMKALVPEIARRRGLGGFLAEGVMRMASSLGEEGRDFAVHVKGLEVSAYDCHAAPGMALAYGTSPIGAHHKDAWIISYEVSTDRFSYSREKVERVVYLQNVRGGLFESLTVCRLPWVELGLDLQYYLRMMKHATGIDWSMDDIAMVSQRIYSLIRAFWIRERGSWRRELDYPPIRWFKQPLTRGSLAGKKLDLQSYDKMLSMYYEIRGWDERGIPRKKTLSSLGLDFVAPSLEASVGLS